MLVKEQKRPAATEELAKVRLEEEELENDLCFKYFGAMQDGDEDPIVPVNHSVTIAWARFRDKKGTELCETPIKTPHPPMELLRHVTPPVQLREMEADPILAS